MNQPTTTSEIARPVIIIDRSSQDGIDRAMRAVTQILADTDKCYFNTEDALVFIERRDHKERIRTASQLIGLLSSFAHVQLVDGRKVKAGFLPNELANAWLHSPTERHVFRKIVGTRYFLLSLSARPNQTACHSDRLVSTELVPFGMVDEIVDDLVKAGRIEWVVVTDNGGYASRQVRLLERPRPRPPIKKPQATDAPLVSYTGAELAAMPEAVVVEYDPSITFKMPTPRGEDFFVWKDGSCVVKDSNDGSRWYAYGPDRERVGMSDDPAMPEEEYPTAIVAAQALYRAGFGPARFPA